MLFLIYRSHYMIFRNETTIKNYVLHNLACKRFVQTDKTKRGSDGEKYITPEPIGGIGEIWIRPNLKSLPSPPKTPQDFINFSNKHWVSYGFDNIDMKTDRPDVELRHWVQREAYLELERREKYGLPLIDKNYVDPATIHLPSEEELEGINIYI